MKKRMFALFLAFSMIIGMMPGNMASATGAGDESCRTILAVQAGGAITDDDTVSEIAYTDTAFIEPGGEGAPSGSVAAAWDKDNLYLGITSKEAASVKVELGSGAADASLVNGAAETVISWKEAGVTLQDYNQVIDGLKITLTSGNSVSSEMTASVKITSLTATDVDLSKTPNGIKGNMEASADQIVWTAKETASANVAEMYTTKDSRMDHSRDILLTQTLNIESMPVTQGLALNRNNATDDYYYFVLADSAVDDTGSAFWGNVYCADDQGNLCLRINYGEPVLNETEKSSISVALGRTLGQTFQLAVLWNADDSAVVYVDGREVCSIEMATLIDAKYWGNKTFRFSYKTSENNVNKAKFTLSDVAISISGAKSITEAMTRSAILGSMDFSAVTGDLSLPAVYTDATFGDVALQWVSSDETILGADGRVTQPAGTESRTVQLSLVVYGKTLWTTDVTVLPAASGGTVSASCADEITVDGVPDEKYYIRFESITASGEGAPSGKVYLAYNKNGLYVGVEHENAKTLEVSLNGKTSTVSLPDGTVTGAGLAQAGDGCAEILLAWSDLGVTLQDYYQEIPGFQVTLTGEEAAASSLNSAPGTLVISSEQVKEVLPKNMTALGSGVSAEGTSGFWNSTAPNSIIGFYNTGYEFIDLTKDTLFTQTLYFEELPVSTGTFSGEVQADDSYYFWVCDYMDKGADDGIKNNSGTAVMGAVYRGDDEGSLYLRIFDGNDATSPRIALGKKVGDTFKLAIQWKADRSALVFVDGVQVYVSDNANTVKTQYMGEKAIQMRYRNVSGSAAKFTVSDVTVSAAGVVSVLEEITAAALLPGVDLNNVQTDLTLPAVFASPYLGDIPLTWESSDPDVIDAQTGEVIRPDSDESAVVELSVSAGGRELWTVEVTVTPAPAEELGPYPASPGTITAAFTAEAVTIDGKPGEYGWLLNTRVLDAEGMAKGKFGVQWNKDTLYLAAKLRGITTMTLTVNNKRIVIDTAELKTSGDASVSAIAKKNGYLELAIPMSQLGLTIDSYNTMIPITVDLDGNTFAGNLKLASIDWFAADNEYRPIPAPTRGTVSLGVDQKVDGCQGYEQVTDGWRIYDLFNAGGPNPAKIRTYVIFIKDALYEPMGDRSRTIYIEFDFMANALPVYDVGADTSLSNHFASYGMTWFVADDDDAAKNAGTFSMGIINTVRGLALIGLPGSGVPMVEYLNREVGDVVRIGTAWKTNGDLVVYLDGEELVVWEGLEAERNSFGDKSVAFNLVRNGQAAAGAADNMDVTITNVAMGHSYDDSLLDQLTFAVIAGKNKEESEITSDLSLPASLTDPLLGAEKALTWISSDNTVIDPATGKVTRPGTGRIRVSLTAALANGEEKTFNLIVLGFAENGDVLVVTGDRNPAAGAGVAADNALFTLDTDNNSVIIDLKESRKVNVAALKDGDSMSRLNEEVLTLWVSEDNVTYTRVDDFKLLHRGDTWYLYDFAAKGRYVKVHCTHYNGEEADFTGAASEMIQAYYEDVFGDGGEAFSSSREYVLTNETGVDRYDYAWSIAKSDLGITGTDASIRVFAGEKLMYHYVDGDNVIVRIPYVDKGASITLTVLSGNAAAMDIANKEYVHEVTYGTREAWTVPDGAHWILTVPAGTRLPDETTLTEEVMLVMGGSNSMIWRAFSYDGGRSWTGKEIIECTRDYITEGGGMIFDSVTGRIMFHGHKVVKYDANNLDNSKCDTNLIYSDDGGKTWQKLTTVISTSKYILSYTDGIQLSCYDGAGPNVDFVFPLGAQDNSSGGFCGRVAYTTDGGASWQTSDDKISYLEGKAHEGGISECTIQETGDGVLVLIGRNQASGTDVFAKSYSYDHGLTWTDAALTSTYTVNTQPIMFKYDGLPMLTWAGKTVLGDDSYIRGPYTVGVSYDGMETFDNQQDLYVKYSLQGLTFWNVNRVTNQSVQMTEDDTLVTCWWNSTRGWTQKSTVFLYVEDFHDFFYRTKGAYDSFEHGTVKYEGWEASVGTAALSDELASDGRYSMKLVNAVAGRSIPYIQEGVISMDLYVDSASDFTVELQSAFSNRYGKCAPVGFAVNGYDITFLGADSASGLKLKNGWNTVSFTLDLDGTGTATRSNSASAALSVNGGEPAAMPVNLEIGDYVTWITLMNVGTTYVDEILVVDGQDAMDSQMLKDEAREEAANKAAAPVIEAIDGIGEVTLESEEAIKAAREAYEKLTDEQKEYVVNYNDLLAAEEKLEELKAADKAEKEAAADKAAADDVIAKIEAIGTVNLNSEQVIKEARSAYDTLTDAQKALVSNYAKLAAAEKRLEELKADQNKPGDVDSGDAGSDDSGSGSSSGDSGSDSSSGGQSFGGTGDQTTNTPTGDNVNFILPLTGILISMIVMAGVFAVFKKKKSI